MDSTDLILLLIFIGAGLGVLYTEGMILSTADISDCTGHKNLPENDGIKECYYHNGDLYADYYTNCDGKFDCDVETILLDDKEDTAEINLEGLFDKLINFLKQLLGGR